MKPLNLIYTIKIFLGASVAVLCLLVGVDDIIMGAAISVLVYIGVDRVLKQIFIGKVENPKVVTRTGIGVYVITWLFLWILVYTVIYTLA